METQLFPVAGQKKRKRDKKNRHSGQNNKPVVGTNKTNTRDKKTRLGQNKKLNSGQKKISVWCVCCCVVCVVCVLLLCCVVLLCCRVLLCCCFGCVGCVVCRVLCAVLCVLPHFPPDPPLRRTTLFVTAPRQDRFRRTPLCVSAVCVWSKICVLPRPSSPDRPSAGPLRRTAQNFALFFSLPATIFILSSLSWGSFR